MPATKLSFSILLKLGSTQEVDLGKYYGFVQPQEIAAHCRLHTLSREGNNLLTLKFLSQLKRIWGGVMKR